MGLGSFLGKMVGSGVGELGKDIADVVDRFVETDEEKKAADILLMKVQQEPDKWQAEINKVGAGHRSVFVAGWRPFIGWICGTGIGLHFIVFPLLEWYTAYLSSLGFGTKVVAPSVEVGALMTLVLGMLGMSATRTYEKNKGLTK